MRLCTIPGDGIGPEVIAAALEVLRSILPTIEVVEAAAGWGTFQATGVALPAETLAAARGADAVLFGAVGSPSHPVPGYRSPIVALRRELDLYANIRPTVALPIPLGGYAATPCDLVVVRENTEDLYAGRERWEEADRVAIAERVISRYASERIVRSAFNLARQRVEAHTRQAKVTIVHKANVLRLTDGLFRTTALEVAQDFPDIGVEELLVDTAAMHLARTPERFDVIVTTNMFGDILSDIACIHGGGLGLASSANIGPQHALFEPVHGAAPDIAGRGIANPLATVGCLAMLMAQRTAVIPNGAHYATQLRGAIAHILRYGPHTPDLGGTATTQQVTAAVIHYVNQ